MNNLLNNTASTNIEWLLIVKVVVQSASSLINRRPYQAEEHMETPQKNHCSQIEMFLAFFAHHSAVRSQII